MQTWQRESLVCRGFDESLSFELNSCHFERWLSAAVAALARCSWVWSWEKKYSITFEFLFYLASVFLDLKAAFSGNENLAHAVSGWPREAANDKTYIEVPKIAQDYKYKWVGNSYCHVFISTRYLLKRDPISICQVYHILNSLKRKKFPVFKRLVHSWCAKSGCMFRSA